MIRIVTERLEIINNIKKKYKLIKRDTEYG